jgi:LmbE family N-acetylglucosaminyl deacetylase
MTAPLPLGRFEWLAPPRTALELLIVAPHPDDEVIGPGGRACLLAGRGVGAIVVTDGARGANGRSEPGLAQRRAEEALAGLRAVGADFGWLLMLTSPNLQSAPQGAAADAIAAAIGRFAPKVVVTTSPYERHPTHLATTRATLAAVRRSTPRPRLEGFPVWDPVPGADGVTEVDVSAVLDRKLAAIRCHASQCADRPFAEAARAQMERDGTLSELTGTGGTRFVERYLDLDSLARGDAPPLRTWLRQRFERDLDLRLGTARDD